MNYISTIFFFLLTIAAFGQTDTSKIKITSKHYYEYAFQERQCPVDSDAVVSDSVINDVKEVTYAVITTGNQSLNRFINDTIRKIAGVNELKETSPRVWKYDCIWDKPSESYKNYKVNFINSRYLSLTITAEEEAGGGANGSGEMQIAVTFDLQKAKTLVLKDVVKQQYDRTVYGIVIAQLKALLPELFDQFGETNNPNLFHFTSTLDLPIAIKKDRVIIYWEVSWGGHISYEAVNIYFDKYAELFYKKIIAIIQEE